ncbi:MAG: hypothetical protein ACYCVH_05900 [Ignavibacteriaceae bacterium]
MSKSQIYFIVIAFIIILSLLFYYYILNIYEVAYSVNPKNLFADYKSTVIIKTIPINALGFEAPFRHSRTNFKIIEGKELVNVYQDDERHGILILKAKDQTGKVVVSVKSVNSLLPSEIIIFIYPNYADK